MRQRILITLFSVAAIAISQLSVFAQTFLAYHCRDGSEFIVAFYEGDKRAHLQLDGKAIALQGRISLSGSRYRKGDITLKITKTVATLKRGRRLTECSTK
jgi:membrane-bound inhibitor of C-type lysozyme